MLGRKVRAALAALASPGVAFLQIDLVIRAILHPDLEGALDVHLDHVLLLQAVLGLEELFEDGVVKSLGAEQTDVEQEGLGHLAGFAVPHDWRRGGLAAHADQCEAFVALLFGIAQRKRVGAVCVARTGGGENLLAGRHDDRLGLPRVVFFDAGDERRVDVVVLA